MIKNILVFIINLPIFLLSKFMVRNPKIWVFGAWFGKKYSDNSKYLFEYVNKNRKDITAVWLTTNDETYKLIKQKGYNVVKTYGFKGYWYTLTAKYAFISVHHIDINFYAGLGIKIINLWHGSPLKKVLKDDKVTINNQTSKHPIYRKLQSLILPKFYSLIVSSDEIKSLYSSAFRGLTKRIEVLGQPRCDAFYMPVPKTNFTDKLAKLKEKNKIGIYMPTHRKEGIVDFSEFLINELDNLNNKMKEINVILLIKLHFYHQKDIDNLKKEYSNIIFISDKDIEQDIYSILPLTDFLITDYSSVYFDYLCTDKPVIFFNFDKDDYLKNDREFYFDYDEVTGGEKAENWETLYDKIKLITENTDYFREKRKDILQRMCKYPDGKNSERIVEWVLEDIHNG